MTMQNEKLVKFFLMLGSDQDGEVVAAARMMGRWLKQEGKDWHDLASHMGAFGSKSNGAGAFAFRPKPKPQARPQRGITIEDMVNELAGYDNSRKRMTTGERAFIEKMHERFQTYGERAYLSDKQQQWITDLHMKYMKGWGEA